MPASPRKLVIGLLGGPGSGKSLVARCFEREGCGVIDADRLAQAALDEPDVVAELRAWWGDAVVRKDGKIDRPAVGQIVFNNPAQRQRLESLVHPKVHAARARLREQMAADPAVQAIVEDTPLIVEASLLGEMDKLVFVDAPWATRLARVSERGWDEAELQRRESHQASLDSKRRAADDVLDNGGSVQETHRQVRILLSRYLGRAPHGGDKPEKPNT